MARSSALRSSLSSLCLILLSSSLLVFASDPRNHIASPTDSSSSRSFTRSLVSLFFAHTTGDDGLFESEAAGASVTDPSAVSDYVSDDVDLTDDFDLWKNLINSKRPITASTGVTVTDGHIYLPEIRMRSFFAQHTPRSLEAPTVLSSSSDILIYPSNISAVYQARWTAAPNTTVANVIDGEVLPFAFTTGEYLFRLVSYSDTSSPLLRYVEGVVNIRDSADTPDKDFRFRVRGLYFMTNGLCFLYSPAPSDSEQRDLVDTVQSWNYTTDLTGAVTAEFVRMTEAAARQEGEAIENSQVTDCHMRITLRFAPSSSIKSGSQSVPSASPRPQDMSDGSLSGSDDTDEAVNLSNLFILSGSLVSPNCGLNLTISNITVFRFDLWYSKVINYCIMVVCMSAIQIYVLMQQMRDVATPARAVKVSLASIGQQALLDSYLCFMHLAAAMYFEPLFHAFLTTAFFEFIIFSLFEMRFLLSIWKARRPDAFNSGFDVMRREFSKLYIRFYLFLIVGLIVLYQARTYLDLLVFVLYSFWVPQIVSNAKADVSKSLSPRYIIGMSVTRLAIPLYVWGCPENVIKMPVNPYVCVGLTLWMGIQIGVLLLQDRFGPRFFIPPQFLPPKYNYHQLSQLPQTDVESGEENPCAICYSAFDANFDPRTVMRTPCDHVFHTECLTRWMDQKMECPTCRGPLPPL